MAKQPEQVLEDYLFVQLQHLGYISAGANLPRVPGAPFSMGFIIAARNRLKCRNRV